VESLPEEVWHLDRGREGRVSKTEEREWAEVVLVLNWARSFKKQGVAFRSLAVRALPRQRELLDTDPTWRHCAVVTNRMGDGARILRWQRGKQGPVEPGHGAMKDDLGAGVLSCGRFRRQCRLPGGGSTSWSSTSWPVCRRGPCRQRGRADDDGVQPGVEPLPALAYHRRDRPSGRE